MNIHQPRKYTLPTSRDKSSSLKKKSNKKNFNKVMSVRELPKYNQTHSHQPTNRQYSSGKKTVKNQSKKKVSPPHHATSIEERVAKIQRGFQELAQKLSNSPLSKSPVPESKRDSVSPKKSQRTSTRKTSVTHRCVYEKAVYSLVNIIQHQKNEIAFLRKQLTKGRGSQKNTRRTSHNY